MFKWRALSVVSALVLVGCGSGNDESQLQRSDESVKVFFKLETGAAFRLQSPTISLTQVAKNFLPKCTEYTGTFFGFPNFSQKSWTLQVPLANEANIFQGSLPSDSYRNGYCGAPLLDQSFGLDVVEVETGSVFNLGFWMSENGVPFEKIGNHYRVTLSCIKEVYPETGAYTYECQGFKYPVPKGKKLEIVIKL